MRERNGKPWLSGLNPHQLEAVEHGEGPLLIIAGAGSGKTRVIIHRMAHLVRDQGVDPSNILAVTFTNKAAEEMHSRVEGLLGVDSLGIWVSTFHSLGARILRKHIDRLGYERSFVIYDDIDQVSLLKRVIKDNGYDPKMVSPKMIRSLIDRVKRSALDKDSLDDFPDPRVRLYKPLILDYGQRLMGSNAVDFGDLLLLTCRLFREFPEVLEEYSSRFSFIMVDEYQDTNRVQYLLVKLFAGDSGNVCVVGDEDQSIYSWRGADITNILYFEEDFKNTRVVLLEENYRSTRSIIEAASALISHNFERKAKKLWTSNPEGELVRDYPAQDEHDEARWLIEEVRRLRSMGVRLSEVAVFYRTHAQSRVFEDHLRQEELPYAVYGGPGFYDRKEIKDVLAYLKFLENPGDEVSLMRIINVPARGIGDKTVEAVAAKKREQGSDWLSAIDACSRDKSIAKKSRAGLLWFIELMDELSSMKSGPLPALAVAVMEKSGYKSMLEDEGTLEASVRLENLDELVNAMVDHESRSEEPGLAGFLEKVSLVADIDRFDPVSGKLNLMTLHSAKGLEFRIVFMVGMVEGLFPHPRALLEGKDENTHALEEERRLCYVGMTRAMELLYLSYPASRSFQGRRQRSDPSRFLAEIPKEYVHRIKGRGRIRRPARKRGVKAEPPRSMDFGDSEIVYEEPAPDYDQQPDYGQDHAARLRPGDRVRHPSHGNGTVERLEGSGEKLKVVVRFAKGAKKFMAKYASLELLD